LPQMSGSAFSECDSAGSSASVPPQFYRA
jgi:hypothetical protein